MDTTAELTQKIEDSNTELFKATFLRDKEQLVAEIAAGHELDMFPKFRHAREACLPNYCIAAGILLRRIGRMCTEQVAVEQLEDVHELLSTGSIKDRSMRSLELPQVFESKNVDFQADSIESRWDLLRLYLKNPTLVEAMLRTEAVVGHGSNSGSLIGVIEHGLRPQAYLTNVGCGIYTGEHEFSGASWNQKYASTAVWRDFQTLNNYANPESKPITIERLNCEIDNTEQSISGLEQDSLLRPGLELLLQHKMRTRKLLAEVSSDPEVRLLQHLVRENFPVMYFVRNSAVEKHRVTTEKSGIDLEIWIEGGVKPTDVALMLVPEEQIDFVTKLQVHKGVDIEIHPIESYRVPVFLSVIE